MMCRGSDMVPPSVVMTVAPLAWCTTMPRRMSGVDAMRGPGRQTCVVVVLVPAAGRCAACLGGLGQGAEIQLDHPGVAPESDTLARHVSPVAETSVGAVPE